MTAKMTRSAVTTKTLKPVRVSKQSSNFLHIALLSSPLLAWPGESQTARILIPISLGWKF